MRTETIHIDNLKCGGCANTIRRNVLELRGVMDVVVDAESDTVQVQHDGAMDASELRAMLHRLGYPEAGTGGILEKMKSFVSCAVGRVQGAE